MAIPATLIFAVLIQGTIHLDKTLENRGNTFENKEKTNSVVKVKKLLFLMYH